jgi:hypothetical protein
MNIMFDVGAGYPSRRRAVMLRHVLHARVIVRAAGVSAMVGE